MTDNHHRMLIVRHSERIDEVDLQAWFRIVERENETRLRSKRDLSNDPILTENGKLLADRAGISLKRMLSTYFVQVPQPSQTPPTAIFCSRLKRCVETAYRLALELRLPIIVSKGLALTAKAVEEREGGSHLFGFLDLEEIRKCCPQVNVFSSDFEDFSGPLVDVTFPCTPHPHVMSMEITPQQHWREALITIARRHPFSIVVAHRETIRNLAGSTPVPVPYCCMAIFKFKETEEQTSLVFKHIFDNEGNKIQ